VAIFGRKSARQRLRRATQESFAVPTFSSPVDCTPWVIGGIWPAELSTITSETAAVAEYLKADLERITSSANDELKSIRRAGMPDSARHVEEARVIEDARARALRRVESTVRHLHTVTREGRAGYPRRRVGEDFAGADMDETQVIPAITAEEPAVDAPGDTVGRHAAPAIGNDDEPEDLAARHHADDDKAAEAVPEIQSEPARATQPPTESDDDRLQRLLAFVARQEPRLNWAVGDYADGTTVLVTDLAHGWIPSDITIPAGVRLLEPDRRTGKASVLVGNATCAATYSPGDSLGWSAESAATKSSVQPRELPAVADLGWVLGTTTHWRDGLPRMVHTLAKAAAAGSGVVEEEVNLLRVYLETARYQLLDQYPNVDPALLLNCLLLAATEGLVTGDTVSANYHLAWFQKLAAPPASRWTANP
jgi:Family of unknown function (DUF5631)/Family of unknown function (DUF5632)